MSDSATSDDSVTAGTDGSDHDAESAGFDPLSVFPQIGLVVLYTATVLGGLALTDGMAARGLVLFDDPGNVGNVGELGVILLVFTAVMVLAFRYQKGTQLLRGYFLLTAGMLVGTVFVVVTGIGSVATGSSLLAGFPTSPAPIAVGLATAALLWVYPEWYVNDIAAVVFGAAAIPMLGLGFGPLPIVVLLVVWAGYDAFAVYYSGHMQELAAGLGDLKLPLVFVVPHSLSYSMREDGFDLGVSEESEDDEGVVSDRADNDRADNESGEANDEIEGAGDVAILGLGDAIIPGMLAVSAGQFLDAPELVPALNANAPAIGAVLGGLVGMAALLYLVHRVDGAHAGLPPLNAGVLGGYLLGAVVAGVPVTAALGI